MQFCLDTIGKQRAFAQIESCSAHK